MLEVTVELTPADIQAVPCGRFMSISCICTCNFAANLVNDGQKHAIYLHRADLAPSLRGERSVLGAVRTYYAVECKLTLLMSHWIIVGTMPKIKAMGIVQYGPLNPYNSLASDHVTAALFKLCGTCPLHTFVPIGSTRIARCASTTETMTTKNLYEPTYHAV